MDMEPTTIQQLSASVPQALALLAAMELDVFTPLSDAPLTTEELAQRIGLKATKLQPLLAVLVSAGLLRTDDGRFANTPEADQFLVRGRAAYMGGVYELWADLWRAELQTAQSIRLDMPQAQHHFATMSPDELRAFVRGSLSGAVSAARLLTNARDLSACHSLLDVGGGSGGLALTLAEKFPHLRATIVELAVVAHITHEFVGESSCTERVSVIAADMTRDVIVGQFDVAVCNRFIQVLAPADAQSAIENIAHVLKPEGALYIIGHVLDDSGLAPTAAVNYGLLAINLYDGGQAFTEAQHRAWLSAAGFSDVTRELLPNGYSLMSARKRGERGSRAHSSNSTVPARNDSAT